ncbi:hypothetical protein TSAR_011168 [Trichomalopsis sarcophagae]|uniref:Uncharacterized protein n=1 Tax=Trichomalopsis sarcophagae TaxID=543379 RepID=A0A232EPV1_9HYME|nr:hypothetical protein TSAR_011168 [Trichomalopsis sarcophagae]
MKTIIEHGIQSGMLSENKEAQGRISETGWTIDNVVSNAYNIHKSVETDLSAIMIQVKHLERRQVALKKRTKSLGLMLSKMKMSPNQQHIQKEHKASKTIEASNAVTTRTLNKRKAMPLSQEEERQENYAKRTRRDKEVASVVVTSKSQSQVSLEEKVNPLC